MKNVWITLIFMVFLGLPGNLLASEPFSYSADQITTVRNGGVQSVVRSRVFVSGPNLREEVAGVSGPARTIMIVRMGESKAWSLDPERKMALSIPFRLSDAQKMLVGGGKGLPSPSGSKNIEGVLCDRYDLVENGHPEGTLWKNHKTGFPVEYRSANGQVTTVLSNVKPGPQPAALFVVPPEYRVMNLEGIGGILGNALEKMAPSLP
ncbi:MAG: hypothetical protein C75L2_00780026 [Leptospirillum sp. Group II 'C75']|jgi:hypothetical protein|uniref:hypothetical protein n=1 Tax=Leptospirillum sp. Group II 'CF-1' TaxID=1660083 RepID=UPI0000F0CC5C|nr:hypothetical protein [Leptospirillum sp. Group II 'CF-1']AKS22989.1 hypothetical protein ABH19_03305 [Leptospirillum sp. Group II 'CF-1']EAY57511.1 MAG: protein of unknown function [Leptospirillum rubarum]EIJ75826.1 MAG: hypothetical protein C75L2_00780026 [Leptospirillum sp. Group II 'C75']